MNRYDDLAVLYTSPPRDRKLVMYDRIMKPCNILQVLSIDDIIALNRIAKNNKLSTRPKQKIDMIKTIMMNRGFKKLAAGTNRIVFKYMEDQSFVIKVAFDSVGLSDNTNEYYNQELLKPFCTKVFEVSPCGTVGMFERVHTIRNRKEFASIAPDVYDVIINRFIGNYVMDDFGSKFFMNWGVRDNIYPVILDFPYVYKLDGAKLYCNKVDDNSLSGFCGGEIDYDDGFNHLICTRCGKRFLASDLKAVVDKRSDSIIIEREDPNMIITITKGDNIIYQNDTEKNSDLYRKDKNGRRKETPYEYRQRKKKNQFKCSVVRGGEEITFENQNDDERYSVENIPTPDNISRGLNISIQTKSGKMVYSKDGKNVIEDEQEAVTRIEDVITNVQNIVQESYEEEQVESTESRTDYKFRHNEEEPVEVEVVEAEVIDDNKRVIEGDVSAQDILEIVPREESREYTQKATDLLLIIPRDEQTPSEFF